MATHEPTGEEIDWSLTTWEGARREQARRWARMSLAEMILALEEMQALAEKLRRPPGQDIERAALQSLPEKLAPRCT